MYLSLWALQSWQLYARYNGKLNTTTDNKSFQWGSKYARGLEFLKKINMDRIVHLWWRILQVKGRQTRQIWGIWKLRPAYSPETPNLGQNRWCFVPCDLEIWWMTLENNRAPLLCCFKLYASFRSHRWIQAGATVRKRPIWVKIDDFLSRVTLKFDVWPWKIIGHLYYATSSFVHHFVAIGDFKLELQSGNAQFGSNSTIFRAVWPWNLRDDLEKQ